MPVHHRLRFLTFPMRASRLCSLWPDMRPLRFRRAPFGRNGTFDPGGATASRIVMPHMLPSTVPSVSASAKFFLSWLNPPPHPITVYAHPPSPTTAQHSLPGGALPPYRAGLSPAGSRQLRLTHRNWKFESIPLQQRVHKLSVPVRAGRRIAFTRAYPMQPLAQLPAVCATGLAAATGWSSVLSISSNVRPLVSGPNAQKPITPRMYQDAK